MKKKAFTLIELVVVMAIIAVLSLMIIGAIVAARRMTTETKHRNNGKSIQVGMEKFYAANKRYPNSTQLPAGSTFETARVLLGVTLDSTAGDGAACTTGGAANGGGTITGTDANGSAFSINPYNYICTVALGDVYSQPQ